MKRDCSKCGDPFDPNSALKARAGGKIDHCPSCSEETVVPYLGLTSGDGKASGVTILAFDNMADREKYADAWADNSGMHKGAYCQLSSQAAIMTGLKFRKVHEQGLGMNHKGKL